jgi:hypothetical protein
MIAKIKDIGIGDSSQVYATLLGILLGESLARKGIREIKFVIDYGKKSASIIANQYNKPHELVPPPFFISEKIMFGAKEISGIRGDNGHGHLEFSCQDSDYKVAVDYSKTKEKAELRMYRTRGKGLETVASEVTRDNILDMLKSTLANS